MPAVTADYLRLPRLDSPPPEAAERGVVGVTTAPTGLEGEGFPVHRAFAGVPLAQLDPFVHMDQMGEVQYAPGEPKGTPWHPHRGFETVTYMIDGRFQHQDSHGGGGMIENGATQWMTAGAGILHIETPPEDLVISGGLFHGVQLWVNLPAKTKMIPPAYQSIEADDVVLVASADAGALVRAPPDDDYLFSWELVACFAAPFVRAPPEAVCVEDRSVARTPALARIANANATTQSPSRW
jgi:hypothetical protein